jgi:hypothetical protein
VVVCRGLQQYVVGIEGRHIENHRFIAQVQHCYPFSHFYIPI